MKANSEKYDNPKFSKRFWKGFWMCVTASAGIAIGLVILALIALIDK
jgi:hypothetical protein